MKKFVFLGVVAAGCAVAGQASAGTYIVEEARSRYITCYNKVYVPAKVLVNTRGRKVRGEGTAWEVAGDRWNYVRNPAVFIETRTTVESDHYTLQVAACQ